MLAWVVVAVAVVLRVVEAVNVVPVVARWLAFGVVAGVVVVVVVVVAGGSRLRLRCRARIGGESS